MNIENHNNEPIYKWIREDKKLSSLLSEIEKTTNSFKEQARIIFHKVPELYNLPKYPEDVDEDQLVKGLLIETSVYEQVGLIKYLEPSVEMLRGNVLTAVYFMLNEQVVDLTFIHDKYASEGGNNDDVIGLGFKGTDIDVELVLVKKGESWFELGCKYFIKYS